MDIRNDPKVIATITVEKERIFTASTVVIAAYCAVATITLATIMLPLTEGLLPMNRAGIITTILVASTILVNYVVMKMDYYAFTKKLIATLQGSSYGYRYVRFMSGRRFTAVRSDGVTFWGVLTQVDRDEKPKGTFYTFAIVEF